MKRAVLLFAVVVMVGCKQASHVQAVVNHPAGSETKASDCHPAAEMPAKTSLDIPLSAPKRAEATFPECPKNMRTVLPSDRQILQWYPKTPGDDGYELEQYMNAEYTHSTCIPDGL
jgi:hypothetical protein